MRLSDSQHMRDADSAAIHIIGIPSDLLMTNSAGHIARTASEIMRNPSAVIFCGSGNNGGDGVASALYLTRWGVKCRVFLVGRREKMTHDTLEMERRLISLGGHLEDFDPDSPEMPVLLKSAGVIIDAIFGIGLSRELSGAPLTAVRLINASGAPVVSADIASGVDADTGRIMGDAVRATRTVTFSRAKPGHFVEPGCTCCGELSVVDIGIPDDLAEKSEIGVHAVQAGDISLPLRPRVSHKSDYGRLAIIGGSVGYTGAPSLCARAALRSGAGLVDIGVPESIYQITAVKNDEAMPFPLPSDAGGRISAAAIPAVLEKLDSCTAAVIGPGMGRSDELTELMRQTVSSGTSPLIIDADGLFALSRDMNMLKTARRTVILTPHEGEFARMGGILTGDRVSDAKSFAQKHGCILVLKGHRTITAFPGGGVYINTCGNPGMAKGGSGDVLAGVIGALACQLPADKAVITAVWLHSRAGDLCAEALGEYSMLPTDIIEALPRAFQSALTHG